MSTDGFDVLVHDVMAAITTDPCPSSNSSPFMRVRTELATGACTWMALEWWTRGKPSVLGMISGAVAGLGHAHYPAC